MPPVPLADSGPELHVSTCPAGKFDEPILVQGGDTTRGCLSADPIGLLGQAYGVPTIGNGQGCADATHSSARDQHVTADFGNGLRDGGMDHGATGVTGERNVLDVENGVVRGSSHARRQNHEYEMASSGVSIHFPPWRRDSRPASKIPFASSVRSMGFGCFPVNTRFSKFFTMKLQ